MKALAPLVAATDTHLGDTRLGNKLGRVLEQADVPMRPAHLFLMSLGAALGLGLIASVAGASPVVIVLLTAAGLFGPYYYFQRKAAKRLQAFETQLPGALHTMAGSLKAGHSFRQAMQTIVDEAEPPIDVEFSRVLAEARLGRPIESALDEMGRRVGSTELDFALRAVVVQQQVGGSIAGLFELLAETLTQRQQFRQKVRSLTAQGRLTATLLIGLPFVIAFLISLVSPGYLNPLFHTGTGQFLIVLGVDHDVHRGARAPPHHVLQGVPVIFLLILGILLIVACAYLLAEMATLPARQRRASLERATAYVRGRGRSELYAGRRAGSAAAGDRQPPRAARPVGDARFHRPASRRGRADLEDHACSGSWSRRSAPVPPGWWSERSSAAQAGQPSARNPARGRLRRLSVPPARPAARLAGEVAQGAALRRPARRPRPARHLRRGRHEPGRGARPARRAHGRPARRRVRADPRRDAHRRVTPGRAQAPRRARQRPVGGSARPLDHPVRPAGRPAGPRAAHPGPERPHPPSAERRRSGPPRCR